MPRKPLLQLRLLLMALKLLRLPHQAYWSKHSLLLKLPWLLKLLLKMPWLWLKMPSILWLVTVLPLRQPRLLLRLLRLWLRLLKLML
jgi:hypothetical protein